MEEKRGGGMSAEEREKFCRIAKAWHGGGVEKPEIYHQKLVDNFKRAAAYVGFNESTTSLPPSNYPQDAMLMLYGLYKQATEATELDDIPLPKSSDELEQNLYWSRIGMHSMPPTLAMMNFVATVKTVDSEYCARASSFSRESFEQYELNEQLREKEQRILELERKLEDKERELHAIRLDNEAGWAKEDLLREQSKELQTYRRGREAQHIKQIHELQDLFQEKVRQLMELQEQGDVEQLQHKLQMMGSSQ